MAEKIMKTWSGVRYDPFNIRVEDINIYDIATHLSKQSRWIGSTIIPYSVAQHSMRVSESIRLNSDRERLAGLLHDAAEAYTGDIPTPIKLGIPALKTLDDSIMEIIFHKFDLSDQFPLSANIHAADRDELLREDSSLNIVQMDGNEIPPIEDYLEENIWHDVRDSFIRRFLELGGTL